MGSAVVIEGVETVSRRAGRVPERGWRGEGELVVEREWRAVVIGDLRRGTSRDA